MADLTETAPIQIPQLLPHRVALELEIGPGKGRYVLERAEAAPDWGFLAIEVKSKLCRLIDDRAAKKNLGNVVTLRADVRRLLPLLEPDSCLDLVTLHFPDPWWKKKHRKRTVMTSETLDQIARLLKPDGRVLVQTDVFPRATEFIRVLTEHPRFENTVADGGLLEEPLFEARTNREQMCIEADLPVFRILFARSSGIDSADREQA